MLWTLIDEELLGMALADMRPDLMRKWRDDLAEFLVKDGATPAGWRPPNGPEREDLKKIIATIESVLGRRE